jgi:hypothetical protein
MHHRSSAPRPRLTLQSGTNNTQPGAIAIQSGAIACTSFSEYDSLSRECGNACYHSIAGV